MSATRSTTSEIARLTRDLGISDAGGLSCPAEGSDLAARPALSLSMSSTVSASTVSVWFGIYLLLRKLLMNTFFRSARSSGKSCAGQLVGIHSADVVLLRSG